LLTEPAIGGRREPRGTGHYRVVSDVVVRVGAWCDLYTEEDLVAYLTAAPRPSVSSSPGWAAVGPEGIEQALEHHRGGLSFSVAEFVELSDGRRIILHNERGFSGTMHWADLTRAELESAVRTSVLPDDDDEAAVEEHPWEWLAQLAAARGVDVSADDLRKVPHVIEFSDRVVERLERNTA
jgi:hypothetical protein